MDNWDEDVYLELRTLIQVYAGIDAGMEAVHAIWCANYQRAFHETATEHLARHIGWTSTPPPTYG